MRLQKSFAAAVAATVAAVMFSAAIQPVEANIIVIDNFNQVQASTASGSGFPNVFASDNQPGSFGSFDYRDTTANYGQLSASRGFRTVEASSNGAGTGTLALSNDGTGSGTTQVSFSNGAFAYFGYSPITAVDLTGQQYAGFWIETGATSSTKVSGIDAFKGYIEVSTVGGTQVVTYDLPSMWAPNTSTGILFSTLQAINPNLDFTNVDYFYVGIRNTSPLDGGTVYNASAEFKMIAVPEPSQISLLAGAAVTLGAWRRRRLGRDESANGEALAG